MFIYRRPIFQIVTVLIVLWSFDLKSQSIQERIDSLYTVYPKTDDDSLKINYLNFLSFYYDGLDTTYSTDSALSTINRSLNLAKKKGNEVYSNYPYYFANKLNLRIGNYVEALNVSLLYLDVSRNHNNINWEVKALTQMIDLLDAMKEENRAREYLAELESLAVKLDDNLKKAECFNTIGSFYKNYKENEKALDFHQKALSIRLNEKDSSGIAHSYNNIGLVYKNLEEYDKALEFYEKSLKIKNALGDKKGMAGSNINIGKVYLIKKEYEKGIPFTKKGIELTKEIDAIEFQLVGYTVLYELEEGIGNYKEAFKALVKVRKIEEVIKNEESIKQAKELERKYESEKRKQEVKIYEQQSEINKLELEKNQIRLNELESIIWFLGVGFIFIVALIILVLINYKQKKKINKQLSENNILLQKQKEKTEDKIVLLAQKNKEITDSINYAKRIQEAILPSRYSLSESISNGFILFSPKDVVSGDFYWMERIDSKIFLAAADCTGHGVPGAMVSVICANALSKVLLEEKVIDPGKLLDRTREIVVEKFKKSGEDVQDGMDISLCCIDSETHLVQWAGANNPLWIIRNSEVKKFKEIKPDKQPIGLYDYPKPFTTHELQLNSGDCLYMFSDGFADQFGGDYNKKFKSINFKRLLLEISDLTMAEQKSALKKAFNDWKGDNDQVDDVCVIGVRV